MTVSDATTAGAPRRSKLWWAWIVLCVLVLFRVWYSWPRPQDNRERYIGAASSADWILQDLDRTGRSELTDSLARTIDGVRYPYRPAALRILAIAQADVGDEGLKDTLHELTGAGRTPHSRRLDSVVVRLCGRTGDVSRQEIDDLLTHVLGRHVRATVLALWYESTGDPQAALAVRDEAREEDRSRDRRSDVARTLRTVLNSIGCVLLVAYLVFRLWKPALQQPAPLSRDAANALALVMVVYLVAIRVASLWVVPFVTGRLGTGTWAYSVFIEVLASAGALIAFLYLRRVCQRHSIGLRDLGFARINLCKAILMGVAAFCILEFLRTQAMRVDFALSITFPAVRSGMSTDSLVFVSPLLILGDISYGAIVAPLVEETFYRAVLFNALRSKLGFLGAVALASLVFALGHKDPLGYLVTHFCMGAVACVLLAESRSVVPCMILHCLMNTLIGVLRYIT